jgi:hypothetical protein
MPRLKLNTQHELPPLNLMKFVDLLGQKNSIKVTSHFSLTKLLKLRIRV